MRAYLLLGLSILGLHALGLSDALQYERTQVASEGWRLPASLLTHWNIDHALANAAGLVLLAGLAPERHGGPAAVLAAAIGCPLLLHFGLPDLMSYRGASPLVAAALPAALATLWGRGRTGRGISLLLAAGVTLSLLLQAGGMPSPWLPVGIRPTWELHLAGAILGAVVVAGYAYRSRSSKPSS
ncbi:MAG: rhomboid family intramembrane serine protease [Rhodocyclaceae bacterium]|nr:rhomboid family intramembrane serine protease [Rhodocyclaceae bacterium]